MTSIDRWFFLRAGLAAAGGALLSACSTSESTTFVQPGGAQVRAAEAARRPGRVREFQLLAQEAQVDLAGKTVNTWLYGDRLPGQAIRVSKGEVVRAGSSIGCRRRRPCTGTAWRCAMTPMACRT